MKRKAGVIGLIAMVPITFVGLCVGLILAPLFVATMFAGSIEPPEMEAEGSVSCVGPAVLSSAVPASLDRAFVEAANYYDIDPNLVRTIYWDENGLSFREPPPPYGKGARYISSHKGASGPFQFMPGTWIAYSSSNPKHRQGDINDLVDSAYAAAHLLKDLGATKRPMTPGSLETAYKHHTVAYLLGLYNAGSITNFGNPETRKYITQGTAQYQRLTSATGKSTKTVTTVDCQLTFSKPGKGYPNTASQKCPAGTTDRGIERTAKGNVIRICGVHGIYVNVSISSQTLQLWRDAKRDGITFTGYGFRTMAEQIAIRKTHCGTSHYAIYEMPPSACSPPAHYPGQSNHEQGLAIDFGQNGVSVRTRASLVYSWLDKHAINYGFKNLPSEPWHWSAGPRAGH